MLTAGSTWTKISQCMHGGCAHFKCTFKGSIACGALNGGCRQLAAGRKLTHQQASAPRTFKSLGGHGGSVHEVWLHGYSVHGHLVRKILQAMTGGSYHWSRLEQQLRRLTAATAKHKCRQLQCLCHT